MFHVCELISLPVVLMYIKGRFPLIFCPLFIQCCCNPQWPNHVCSAVLQHLCRGLPETSGGVSGRWRTQQQLLWRESQTCRVQELWLGALPPVELRCVGRGELHTPPLTHRKHDHISHAAFVFHPYHVLCLLCLCCVSLLALIVHKHAFVSSQTGSVSLVCQVKGHELQKVIT